MSDIFRVRPCNPPMVLCGIVLISNNCPFRYTLLAYQASLVEPWFLLRLAKIPMARPNEPDMPPKHTKKAHLDINLPYQNSAQNLVIFLVVTAIKSVWHPIVWFERSQLFWSSTLLSSSCSDIFLTHLFGVSFLKFSKSKFSENFGNSDSIVSV